MCVCCVVFETNSHSEALAGTHCVAQDGLEPHNSGWQSCLSLPTDVNLITGWFIQPQRDHLESLELISPTCEFTCLRMFSGSHRSPGGLFHFHKLLLSNTVHSDVVVLLLQNRTGFNNLSG